MIEQVENERKTNITNRTHTAQKQRTKKNSQSNFHLLSIEP